MTGHLLVPGYGDLPATLNSGADRRAAAGPSSASTAWSSSDALEMGAIAGSVGVGEGAVLALLAGVDALCLGGDEAGEPIADAARDALVAAVRSGRLPEARLAEAAQRVRTLARRYPPRPTPAPEASVPGANVPGARGLGERGLGELGPGELGLEGLGLGAARRAVRCAGVVRLGSGAPVVVQLDPEPTIAVGRTAWGLAGLLPGATELRVGPDDPLPPLPPTGRW